MQTQVQHCFQSKQVYSISEQKRNVVPFFLHRFFPRSCGKYISLAQRHYDKVTCACDFRGAPPRRAAARGDEDTVNAVSTPSRCAGRPGAERQASRHAIAEKLEQNLLLLLLTHGSFFVQKNSFQLLFCFFQFFVRNMERQNLMGQGAFPACYRSFQFCI